MTQDIESRITSLHIEAGEGEYHVDFERSGDGWTKTEAGLNEEGYTTGVETRTTVRSLGREVGDHTAAHLIITEVKVGGVTAEEFLDWVRPLLDEGQDSIVINGNQFDA